MTTFDLHYHANIHGLPRWTRAHRLKRISRHFDRYGIGYVASTEHSYKNALKAYQYLAEATADIDTTIIPGVECVSSEGIDIIYLYPDEDALRYALKQFHSFSWSINEVASIREDTGAVVTIPHPFHFCRSAAGNVMSKRSYKQLMKKVDYVEIHNGSALTIGKRLDNSRTKALFKDTREKLIRTIDLPMRDRGRNLGWAVGSDAHYHNEQYVIGECEWPDESEQSFFELLQQRVRFNAHYLYHPSELNATNNMRLLRSFNSALREGVIKELIKTRGRGAALASLMLYYGLYPR